MTWKTFHIPQCAVPYTSAEGAAVLLDITVGRFRVLDKQHKFQRTKESQIRRRKRYDMRSVVDYLIVCSKQGNQLTSMSVHDLQRLATFINNAHQGRIPALPARDLTHVPIEYIAHVVNRSVAWMRRQLSTMGVQPHKARGRNGRKLYDAKSVFRRFTDTGFKPIPPVYEDNNAPYGRL